MRQAVSGFDRKAFTLIKRPEGAKAQIERFVPSGLWFSAYISEVMISVQMRS